MSQRQRERYSRYRHVIETLVHGAATSFRDDDPERPSLSARRMSWTSRLRGRTFCRLVEDAARITRQRVSASNVESGEPGRREAMPYFLAVLRQLATEAAARLAAAPTSLNRQAEQASHS